MRFFPILTGLALAAGLSMSPDIAAAQDAGTDTPAAVSSAAQAQAPGYYRFKLGDLTITALSDGTAAIPWHKILQGMSPDRIRAIFENVGETSLRDTSINAFLVDTGARRILIDAGSGALFGPCCGHLPEALDKAGYPADTIDAVLLTHVHGDHSGGLALAGARVFPNADVYLAQGEYDYWMSDAERERAPEGHRKMFAEGRAALAPYDAAGRLRFFTGRSELFPGITTVPAPGHTPGHSFYRIASKGERVLVVGDIIHAGEVQFPHPDVTASFDADPAQARATRERVLAELARTHELVAADHVSFPGLGHVTKSGEGYRWTAQPYRGAVRKAAE